MKNPFSMFCNVATWKLIALPCHPLNGNYIMFPSHLQPQTTKRTALVSFFTLTSVKKIQSQKGTCMKKPFSMFCYMATSKPMSCPYHPLTCNYIMLLSHLQSQTTKSTALVSFLPLVQVKSTERDLYEKANLNVV